MGNRRHKFAGVALAAAGAVVACAFGTGAAAQTRNVSRHAEWFVYAHDDASGRI
jgi:hypothetical protein